MPTRKRPLNRPIRHAIKHLGCFLLIFTCLYSFYYYLLENGHLIHYFSGLAQSICAVFKPFDANVGCVGARILYNGFPSLVIIDGCDGLSIIIVIVAAILSFPNGFRNKIIGLTVLTPLLLFFNWLRLVILGITKFYFSPYFHEVHLYFFQPVMIVLTLISFIVWIAFVQHHER